MGGFGSGRTPRWNTRATVENYLRIDVRKWKREGLLDAPTQFTLTWRRRGEVTGSINVQSQPGFVILSYRSRRTENNWEQLKYKADLELTPCQFGGSRVWFRCPGNRCDRRVAKLYGGRYFLCRHCHKLPYESQGETKLDRATRRAHGYFNRIRSGAADSRNWLVKPKGMHWKTYWTYYHKGMAELSKAKKHAFASWGSQGAGLVQDGAPMTPYEVDSRGKKPGWE